MEKPVTTYLTIHNDGDVTTKKLFENTSELFINISEDLYVELYNPNTLTLTSSCRFPKEFLFQLSEYNPSSILSGVYENECLSDCGAFVLRSKDDFVVRKLDTSNYTYYDILRDKTSYYDDINILEKSLLFQMLGVKRSSCHF